MKFYSSLWFPILSMTIFVGVLASPAIPNHLETVKAARVTYTRLSGRNRAYCIVNKTAWDLRAEGVGTFYKIGENSFADRSSDVIIYKSTDTFDILGDAEGQAVPQWGSTEPSGHGPIANWRAPIDPNTILNVCPMGVTPIPPTNPCPICPVCPTCPPANNCTFEKAEIVKLSQALADLQKKYDSVSCQTPSYLGWHSPCTVVK